MGNTEAIKSQEEMTDQELNDLFLEAGPGDEYRLTRLDFEPDVIYDIGADVGSITMFAHKTFPKAKIVAVEPNPWSYPRLVKNSKDMCNIICLRKALGQGEMFEPQPTTPPLHWMVVNRAAPTWHENLILSETLAVTLDELHMEYGGERYVVKMDCESAEYHALSHELSVQVILNSHYFAAELHVWATRGEDVLMIANTIWQFMFRLAQTHTVYTKCYGACIHVWADKRIDGSVLGGDGID